jgi:Na+/citrate or Na+/malate symporter
MTPTQARIWLIKASLAAFGCAFVFFVTAPALGYPLSYPDSINVMKIILPIFAGQIGAAAIFLSSKEIIREDDAASPILKLLVMGPVLVFAVGMAALLVSFPLSNAETFTGNGMTPNTLSLLVSLLSGVLSGTTGAISSYLFNVERRRRGRAS